MANLTIKIMAQDAAGRVIKDLTGDLGALATKTAEPTKGLGGIVDVLGKVGFGVFGIKTLAESVGGLATSMVAGNAEFERYETQFGVLLGSAGAAKERLKELADFGAKTPFELPEVVKADKILQGFGLHSEQAAQKFGFSGEMIRTIAGDVAAGTGASFEDMATYIGKFSSGATGEVISRFQELGITTREELGNMGLEFSKSGELLSPLPKATEVVLKLMKQKYGGMMDAQSNTFEGMMSNMSDWIGQTKRELMAPIFEVLKDKLQGLLAWLSSGAVKGALTSFAGFVANVVSGAISVLGTIFDVVGRVLQPVIAVVMEFGRVLGIIVGLIGDIVSQGGDLGVFADDLREMFGIDISPLVTGFRNLGDMIGNLIGVFTDAEGAGLRLHNILERTLGLPIANTLIGAINAMRGLGSSTDQLSGLWEQLQSVVQAVLSEVVPFVQRQLGIIVGWVTENWPLIQRTVDTVMNAVRAVVGTVVSALVDIWRVHGEAILGIVRSIWTIIQTVVETAIRTVLDVVKIVMQLITGDWEGAWSTFLGIFQRLWESVGVILREALSVIGTVLTQFVPALVGVLAEWTGAVLGWIGELGSAIVDGIVRGLSGLAASVLSALSPVAQVFDNLIEVISGALERIWNSPNMAKVRELGGAIVEGITGALATIAGPLADFADTIWNWIGDTAGNVLGKAGEIGQALLNGILNTFSSVGDILQPLGNAIWNWIGDTAGNVLGKAGEIGRAIIDGIRAALRSVAIPLPSFSIDWVDTGWGFSMPQLNIGVAWRSLADLIPELAEGGRIMREGLAMVGERGPELVSLPRGAEVLPLGRAGGGGGRTIQVVVTGNTIIGDDRSIARELARILKPELDGLVGMSA